MDSAFIKNTGLHQWMIIWSVFKMLATHGPLAVAVLQGEEMVSHISKKFCTLFSFSEKRREHSVTGHKKLLLL